MRWAESIPLAPGGISYLRTRLCQSSTPAPPPHVYFAICIPFASGARGTSPGRAFLVLVLSHFLKLSKKPLEDSSRAGSQKVSGAESHDNVVVVRGDAHGIHASQKVYYHCSFRVLPHQASHVRHLVAPWTFTFLRNSSGTWRYSSS